MLRGMRATFCECEEPAGSRGEIVAFWLAFLYSYSMYVPSDEIPNADIAYFLTFFDRHKRQEIPCALKS